MRWIKLGGKQEPEFNERCLWMNANGEWWDGELEETKETSTGKQYIVSHGTEGNQWQDATHYMLIDKPKD